MKLGKIRIHSAKKNLQVFKKLPIRKERINRRKKDQCFVPLELKSCFTVNFDVKLV